MLSPLRLGQRQKEPHLPVKRLQGRRRRPDLLHRRRGRSNLDHIFHTHSPFSLALLFTQIPAKRGSCPGAAVPCKQSIVWGKRLMKKTHGNRAFFAASAGHNAPRISLRQNEFPPSPDDGVPAGMEFSSGGMIFSRPEMISGPAE